MSWHNINLRMTRILFNFIMKENGLDQVIQAKLKSDTTKELIMKELLQWHDSNNSISEGIERDLLDC